MNLEEEFVLGRPPAPVYDAAASNRIFVGIAGSFVATLLSGAHLSTHTQRLNFRNVPAFRDGDRCGNTLFLAFDKARAPERIDIGVVDQRAAGDSDCVAVFCKLQSAKHGSCLYESQVRRIVIEPSMSKGPVFARSHQRQLIGEQTFCMQTDAHMQFVDHWDDAIISQWLLAKNEFAVVSTYVHHIDRLPVTAHTRARGLHALIVR